MGTFQHHAIIVTGSRADDVAAAADKARELGATVIGPSETTMNGYASIMVCPDGSKEHWPDSDAGDARRDVFAVWLVSSGLLLSWVEVTYGEYGTWTARTNCSDER